MTRVAYRNGRLRRPHRPAPLVERAVDLARRLGFANSCRPEHGRLLRALAAGAGTIGETGTGCGAGLAWLAPDLAALVATRRFAAD